MKSLARTDSFTNVTWSNTRLAVGLGFLIIQYMTYHLLIEPYWKGDSPSFSFIFGGWLTATLWMLLFPIYCIYKDNLITLKVNIKKFLKETVVAIGILIVAIIIMAVSHAIIE